MSVATAPGDPASTGDPAPFGSLLKRWRERRRLSQQELSLIAEVSARHLSFLETGRSRPSRAMVLSLAEHLRVPLRERNELMLAAGFAPAYPRRPYDAPELATVRRAVEQVLAGHHPYPALAVDRRWDVVAANSATMALFGEIPPALLGPPLNVYRLTLHPDGLAPRLLNLAEVATHLVHRLQADVEATGDPGLDALLDKVLRYPTVREVGAGRSRPPSDAEVVVPIRLRHPHGELAMFTTLTTFGSPADVTVAELALELLYPLDAATAERLRELADGVPAMPPTTTGSS
jgi:transcriptional regulator with XRE-family HTH domain